MINKDYFLVKIKIIYFIFYPKKLYNSMLKKSILLLNIIFKVNKLQINYYIFKIFNQMMNNFYFFVNLQLLIMIIKIKLVIAITV